MPGSFDHYDISTTDWRKTLRQNSRRTYIVIALFFLIYCLIGLLIDMYLYASTYTESSIPQLFTALITLQLFPIATLIMLLIASVSLFVSYLLYDKLMLLGTEYHEITKETAQHLAQK